MYLSLRRVCGALGVLLYLPEQGHIFPVLVAQSVNVVLVGLRERGKAVYLFEALPAEPLGSQTRSVVAELELETKVVAYCREVFAGGQSFVLGCEQTVRPAYGSRYLLRAPAGCRRCLPFGLLVLYQCVNYDCARLCLPYGGFVAGGYRALVLSEYEAGLSLCARETLGNRLSLYESVGVLRVGVCETAVDCSAPAASARTAAAPVEP